MGDMWENQAAVIAGGSARGASSDVEKDIDSTEDLMLEALGEALESAGCPDGMRARCLNAIWKVIEPNLAAGVQSEADSQSELQQRMAGESARMMAEAMETVDVIICEMLRSIIAAKFSRLEAKVNLMARGVGAANGESIRGLAKTFKLSPAAISKMLARCQRDFCLPKNHFNKSERAVDGYKLTNRRKIL